MNYEVIYVVLFYPSRAKIIFIPKYTYTTLIFKIKRDVVQLKKIIIGS